MLKEITTYTITASIYPTEAAYQDRRTTVLEIRALAKNEIVAKDMVDNYLQSAIDGRAAATFKVYRVDSLHIDPSRLLLVDTDDIRNRTLLDAQEY